MQLSFRAALVVVDVQIGFEDPSWGPRNNPQAETNIGRLLAFWRMTKRPLFYVRHDSISPKSPLRPGQRGNAIKPAVAPQPGERVLAKTVNSAFIGTALEQDLRRLGAPTTVIVGLTTNHCVSTTARMAANLGFRTLVVSDATACFGRRGQDGRARTPADVHDNALSDLAFEFATILDTGMLLDSASEE